MKWLTALRERAPSGSGARKWLLPLVAVAIGVSALMGEASGVVEVEPGEVAVLYNTTGLAMFGEPQEVVVELGVLTFMPGFQRVVKLDVSPQILVMEGDVSIDDDHVRRLTVRASDGSNFYFEKLEIHYQVIPSQAGSVIARNGMGAAYKTPVLVHSREVLRDAFGGYSFLEIADPSSYGAATNAAKAALNERLNPLGIEVTNIPPPKPKFDQRVEGAIEERQNAEQEVEVQVEKRLKLEQEKGRKIQQVEQAKNAEYQQLLAELEASKKQAGNQLIAAKREADLYFIERQAEGQASRDEKVTRAKANEVAFAKEAEALTARINAVGDQGPDVLNRVIAEEVFPQMSKIQARPFSEPRTPFDIRTGSR